MEKGERIKRTGEGEINPGGKIEEDKEGENGTRRANKISLGGRKWTQEGE